MNYRLIEIKERWAKATKGPWAAIEDVICESQPHGDWLEWDIVPVGLPIRGNILANVQERSRMVDGELVFSTEEDRANAEALAHTSDDIKFLVAEVERLQQLLEPHLPKVADISGCDPDFTGGLSSEEYVRRMREG